MSNVKISELTAVTTLSTSALLPVVQSSITKRSTTGAVFTEQTAFSGAGAHAVARTPLAKARDWVNLKDSGAVCDGTTDDTTAITNAIADLSSGGTLQVSGTPLFSSTITVNKRVVFLFDGGGAATSSALPISYFIKKSTATGDGFNITSSGCRWLGGGIVGQAGNTGDNLAINASHVRVEDAYFSGAGSDGVSIGDPAAATDCNYWRLTNIRSRDNGRDGVHVESNTGSTPNANAGTAENCVCDANTRDGFRDDSSATNVYLNCNGSGNGGWGLRTGVSGTVSYPVIIGGDYEANTADGTNQINFETGTVFASVMGLRPEFKILDESYTKADQPFNYLTKRLDKYVSIGMDWEPCFTGSTVAAKTVTSITRSTTTLTFAITGHGYAVGEGFALEDTGTLFDGGYIVASTPTADSLTATVSADRASKLPVSWTGSASTYLGYDATVAGYWQRINDVVMFQANIAADNVALDATVTGNARIRGLPYPAINTSNLYGAVSVHYETVDLPVGTSQMTGFTTANAYYITLSACGDNIAAQAIPVGATGLKITSAVTITGTYRVTPYTV